jgi:hypothetical protein
MGQKLIEDLTTGTDRRGTGQSAKISVVWKFFGEGERTHFDLMFDRAETLTRPTKIGLGRRATNAGTISNALKYKVELDSPPGVSPRHHP